MVVLRFVSLLFLFQFGCAFKNNEYKVINKIPRSPLMRYYSYSSVMILHFYIPDDTIEASFRFKAIDEQTSIFVSKCEPRNISIHMKPGSYPVISPDGVPLPKTFLNISRPEIIEKVILTDETTNFINISSPKPGDWFAVAFISWTDPRKDKIEQQGLTSRCEAYLNAELAIVDQQNIQTISLNNRIEIPLKQNHPQLFKFYIPEDIDHVLIEIQVITPCKHCENISIYVQTASVPTEDKHQEKLLIEGNDEQKKYLWFWPEEETWHYININFISELKDYASVSLKLKYISGLQEEIHTIPNITDDKRINLFKTSVDKKLTLKHEALRYNLPYKQYNLMRVTGSENFVFEYDFRPNINGTTPLLLNITTNEMTVLKFMVQEIVDIGGTLSLGLAIKPDLKTKIYSENYKVVACIRSNSREIPTYPNLCTFNNTSSKAPIVLNSTTAGTLEYFHIPYPDPGMYYMSIRAFYDNCVPCNCSEDCEQNFNNCLLECELNCTNDCNKCTDKCENEILETDGCENCDCDGDCWRNDTLTNTSVIFAITSNPCIAGTCGKRGSCNHYMAGGFIFSSCHCRGGYRGWDCTDGSLALSDSEILVAILLLTLSNLLFIPSIYFAYRRGYYTEAVTYFCSMFASTFYHACDSRENQFGFCLFPHGVLQFCDFYCALLTIWVTLVAMSHTSARVISLAHVIGAIILAFSVTYNKHALWVAALPALFGILLVGYSWGMQCRKTKKLFPAKTYLKLYIPIGGALVFMGLISFAFLETKQNYKIVHSFWHIMMALSLIFLLPNNKVFIPKT